MSREIFHAFVFLLFNFLKQCQLCIHKKEREREREEEEAGSIGSRYRENENEWKICRIMYFVCYEEYSCSVEMNKLT